MNNQLTKGGEGRYRNMTKELTQFKYEQLDESTADFLRQKESNMRQIVGKAYTELGKELYEAQQRLAGNNQYDGVFEKWYTYLGWKKRTVYDLINRYNELVQLSHDQKTTFEELPVTLSYQISGTSSESTPAKTQAKSEVLAGDIASLKEYRERIKELEKKAEAEQAERERLERENSDLANREPETIIKTEYVEVDNTPEDVKELVKERDELDAALSQTYARLRDLEQLEKSVKHQRQSPLYDMHRSLKSALSYVQVFADNDRQSRNIIANSDKDIAEEIQFTIETLIEELEFANDIFMDELQKDIVDADFNEID